CIQAGSSGGLHHDARVLQNLLFGTLLQLATNDVCSPEEAQHENRNKNEIEEDQKFENPHKKLRLSANDQNDDQRHQDSNEDECSVFVFNHCRPENGDQPSLN